MLIKYIGHSCFKIRDNETGYSIIFDPYEPGGKVKGYRDIRDTASMVICSHDHFDHNYRDAVIIEPREESPYDVTFIDAWHDKEHGTQRGPNVITVVVDRNSGEKLIHYGDIGMDLDELLSDERRELLEGADVILLPVGGTYTIDADEALELIDRTRPKIAIPMHFRTETGMFGFDNIGSIEGFLNRAQNTGHKVHVGQLYFYDTQEYPLEDCILAIRPQNI